MALVISRISHPLALIPMHNRTFVFGDLHGEIEHLKRVMKLLPAGFTKEDTLVFLGDYLDRGPDSKSVIEFLMELPKQTEAKVVCLRGNHEDAWLKVVEEGWDEFVLTPSHGCLSTLRSFTDGAPVAKGETASNEEMEALVLGEFLPKRVVEWIKTLLFWYENEHGIFIHAGLPKENKRFLHPSEVQPPAKLAWLQSKDFVLHYRGKHVFFGHTPTEFLPQEFSLFTPDDDEDLFVTEDTFGLDTGCGNDGFLTVVELPGVKVYESRDA